MRVKRRFRKLRNDIELLSYLTMHNVNEWNKCYGSRTQNIITLVTRGGQNHDTPFLDTLTYASGLTAIKAAPTH